MPILRSLELMKLIKSAIRVFPITDLYSMYIPFVLDTWNKTVIGHCISTYLSNIDKMMSTYQCCEHLTNILKFYPWAYGLYISDGLESSNIKTRSIYAEWILLIYRYGNHVQFIYIHSLIFKGLRKYVTSQESTSPNGYHRTSHPCKWMGNLHGALNVKM